MTKFESVVVAAKFDTYADSSKRRLLDLREIIFDVAAKTKGVGVIEETLRWGEPTYLTSATKSGSMIRIDIFKAKPSTYAMYFHCQTNLIDTFKSEFPEQFRYSKNRAIVFNENEPFPIGAVRTCIALALTYKLRQ